MSGVLPALLLTGGLALLLRVLRPRFGGALSALTLLLVALGTFAFDLLLRPSPRPATAFLLAALALSVRERSGSLSASAGALIGAAAGAAAALHWPNAALALLALPRRGEGLRALGAALAAGALVCAIAGLLGLVPPPLSGPWQPSVALLGSRQGLLYLTPALWLSLLGLALQWRREARSAVPAAATVLALFALHAACPLTPVQACAREQLAALLPLLALPMGEALGTWARAVRRAPAAPLWAAGGLLVCWNLLFMQQYADGMIPRDFPVPFPRVAQNAATLLARAAGAPLAWPANWVFAERYDTGPERFDAAAGKRLPQEGDGAFTIDVGRLDVDAALLLEGWSVRHPCGEAVCRAVETEARLLVPVTESGPTEIVVRASGEGALAAATTRGQADPARLQQAAADLHFAVGPLAAGLHAVRLRVTPPARALVDRVTVRPARPVGP